ncbi:cory-CC-star protein [Alloalcanivorax sp. C16-1]|uniref:cory-CC-star protein n=1 Tax=Alloalcanivorax sp. C16-1 TaxID=3390051 RepID=UPI003970DCF4
MSGPRILGRLKHWSRQAGRLGAEYYNAPYRAAIARARRDEQDLFMLLVFAETLGIPNPAGWYTLELQPLLLDRFHDWHQRMGLPHSPLDQFRCC